MCFAEIRICTVWEFPQVRPRKERGRGEEPRISSVPIFFCEKDPNGRVSYKCYEPAGKYLTSRKISLQRDKTIL